MRARALILSFLLLMAAPVLRAQWSGSLDFSSGLGGMLADERVGAGTLGHLLLKGDGSLNYQTEKFTWKTTVGATWEPKSGDNFRMGEKKREEQTGLDVVYKISKTRPLGLRFRSELGWKPSPGSSYSAWITYQYKNDRARNVSNNLSLLYQTIESIDSQQASCYYESPRLDEHQAGVGASASWQLGAKNLLQSNVSLSTTGSRKNTVWSVFKTTDLNVDTVDEVEAFRRGEAWMYRITPSNIDLDISADIKLRNTVRNDSLRFNWTPGVRFWSNHSDDRNSGASLSDITADGSYVWKDSLRLKENFDYLALSISPFVALEFRGKHIEIQADYALQFYGYRLNDDTHTKQLSFLSPYPSGNARLTWRISDVHRLGVTHNVGVNYPNYFQICWYDRTGGYVDQLFRGNEDLVATLHSRYGLTYDLIYKRFRYRTVNAVTRQVNEIDQTWSNEEIEGRLYKVFRWINSADRWSFGTSHRLGWEGKWIQGGVGVEYNFSRRTAKSDGTLKKSDDWALTGDINANLGKDWRMGADVRYQSSVATFFTSFNEYWKLNVHVQKAFKNVTVFFDGKDLLDTTRETIYHSADETEAWVDLVRDNRRLFLLGVRWNF